MEELTRKLIEIGRLHNVQADYEKTLLLLAALKAGDVTLENVTLTEGGWNLIQLPPSAETQPPVAAEVS